VVRLPGSNNLVRRRHNVSNSSTSESARRTVARHQTKVQRYQGRSRSQRCDITLTRDARSIQSSVITVNVHVPPSLVDVTRTKTQLSEMSRLQLVNTSTGQKVLAAIHPSLLHMQIRDRISMKLPPVSAVIEAISCQLIRYTRH